MTAAALQRLLWFCPVLDDREKEKPSGHGKRREHADHSKVYDELVQRAGHGRSPRWLNLEGACTALFPAMFTIRAAISSAAELNGRPATEFVVQT